ncbi:2-amino-4-hydroxy-6-hydroxymethyldihydropteridine diphosphokinase [candidate division WOR-3 bacterium]|nr:2-amino-4-hydroxy-6-hydroxymethyldihydropteridine diphosphokinase [candidate division WOR-3 bacterium]MCK4525775.1 2-amino-4-hydroxy-6-hydroxymethyldihydropteridine diphosphokinase [candidate division WOR-3 bacterium]
MKIYLSLGSNLDNREKNLLEAYKRISEIGETKGSHIYRTEPWGREDLSEFLNACVSIETATQLQKLLQLFQGIEEDMGRERKERWESRIIDIDILLGGNTIYKNSKLEVPHIHLKKRRFYLEPLSEIAKDERDPLTGKTIQELLKECSDEKKVWKTGIILQ